MNTRIRYSSCPHSQVEEKILHQTIINTVANGVVEMSREERGLIQSGGQRGRTVLQGFQGELRPELSLIE